MKLLKNIKKKNGTTQILKTKTKFRINIINQNKVLTLTELMEHIYEKAINV